MDDRRSGPPRRRRARRRRADRGRRPAACRCPDGTVEIDASRRHRDARHDRHPPAHVADRDARLRRRLDAHPVLRLVLPRARQDVPPAGHLRRQPAVGDRVARRRRHHDGRLVARAADRPSTPTPRSTRCSRCPGRFVLAYGNIQAGPVGVVGDAGVPRLRRAGGSRPATTCSASRWPSTSPATRRSRRRPRSRWPASSARRSPRTPASGAPPTTTASGSCTTTASRRRRTIYVHAATLSEDSYQRIAATGGSVSVVDRERAELRARATRPPGRCASTTSRCRCRWTPASGGAATCSPRCAPRSAPTASREHLEAHAQGRHGHQLPPARRAGRRVGHPRRRQGARPRRRRRQPRGRQEGRRRADQERPLAGDVPAAQPLRARGLPGAARRRAHRRSSTAGS